MKKFWFIFILLLIPINVFAENITSSCNIKTNNKQENKLTDNNENSYVSISKDSSVNIECSNKINGIYIIYEKESKIGSISTSEKNALIGENSFLHEYIDVESLIGNTSNLNIEYNEDVLIGEIYILNEGELPEYVEVWNKPLENADLLLFSTHSDDEHLFFLGLLPTYVAREADVQVVYFTNHNDNPKRLHEQLHGLYAVGIRNYPVFGLVPDAYSESLEGAIKNLEKANMTTDDALNFEVNMIRRFKPLVVVGHDELGEYSHGQHILNTYILKMAIEKANDETYNVESVNEYGTWDVLKTYLHLYKENQIIMNYDEPLDYFDGKTAYEVSKIGYSKHNSQQWTWFTKWINGTNNSFTKATDIKKYSPVEFGLYRSLVGEDVNKNDMFENLTFRKNEIKEEENVVDNVANDIVSSINNEVNIDYKSIISYTGLGLFIIIILFYLFKKRKK